MSEAAILEMLKIIAEATPGAVDMVERWVHHEKAKRMAEILPAETHTGQAVDALQGR